MNLQDLPTRLASVEAEQAVLGAILLDNASLDRVPDLRSEHFYRAEHRAIYAEACKQIMAGKSCDAISLFDELSDKVEDCLAYLTSLTNNTPSSASIRRHADTVIERALRRALMSAGGDLSESVATATDDAYSLASSFVMRVEAMSQRGASSSPVRLSESLTGYADLLDDRMTGRIKPIATGFVDLDRRLDGGIERGTLTVVAARPGMGKSAFGLALCRNVAQWGGAAFLSMEMSASQVNDRNVAALGHIPIAWLRKPSQADIENWTRLTHAFQRASELSFYIDDQTALTVMDIRSKARWVRRTHGLDLLVIDQLSFITGGDRAKKQWELAGEYTRGLIALAKELSIAVVLLCQLNRDCENRTNKRPQLSDLAMSGSIEQDASNIIFLYRDEIYNPETMDKGICEAITAKQRQGEPGTVPLVYIGNQTRFEDYAGGNWIPASQQAKAIKPRGFE